MPTTSTVDVDHEDIDSKYISDDTDMRYESRNQHTRRSDGTSAADSDNDEKNEEEDANDNDDDENYNDDNLQHDRNVTTSDEYKNISLESSVYVFGQIVGGDDFGNGAFNCSWEVNCNDNWRIAMGFSKGVTFTSTCQVE